MLRALAEQLLITTLKHKLLWEVLSDSDLTGICEIENFSIDLLNEDQVNRFVNAALDWDVQERSSNTRPNH